LLSRLNYYPFRCHACQHRFVARTRADSPHANGGKKDPRPDARRRRVRRLIRSIVICAACVVAFLLFLYYLTQPGPYTGD
jgi:type VI protein secretion system component VasF